MNAPIIDNMDRVLLWQLEPGLPLVPRPYEAIGQAIGLSENEVIARLKNLVGNGVIRRFGVVVRHHEVGYSANAMVVWDVPDEQLADAVARLTACPEVTLCYRRPRCLPDWPYNLFSMIHGRDEETVRAQVRQLRSASPLSTLGHDVLFSRRRFKQTGACYRRDDNANREVA